MANPTDEGSPIKSKIMKAAASEIATRGKFSSVGNIVSSLNMSELAFFDHFSDIREVSEALVDHFRIKMRKTVLSALPDMPGQIDVQKQTEIAVAGLMSFLREHPHETTVAIHTEPYAGVTKNEVIALFARMFSNHIQEGRIRNDISAEFFATCLVGIILHTSRHPPKDQSHDEIAGQVASLLMMGAIR